MQIKKHIALLLAFFLLISNSGLALNVHYCGEKIAAISSVFSDEEVCEMPVKKEKSCCAKKEVTHKKCCSDKEVNLKVHCSPCVHHTKELPCKGHNFCIKDIQMETVLQQLNALLNEKQATA